MSSNMSSLAAPRACGDGPTAELGVIGDAELVEELSLLTTQTARMRARMADIVSELERRRGCAGAAQPRRAGSRR
jgi:hypothetical protein